MSKTAELIRLTGVILLSLLLLGIVCLIAVCAQRAIFTNTNTSLPPQINTQNTFETVSSLRRQYELHLENAIQTALEKITGPNTVQATVRADFNLLQETNDQSVLLPDSSVVRSTTLAENGTDTTGSDLYEQTTQYDFSTHKMIRHNTVEQIKKLSVTVLIDGTMENGSLYHPRSGKEMQTYTDLIQSITGLNKERGDVLEVINLPFSEPAPFWRTIPLPVLFSVLTLTILTLLSVLILFYFIRPMMKQLMRPSTPSLPVTQPVLKPASDKTAVGKVHNLFVQNPRLAIQTVRLWLSKAADENNQSGLYRISVLLLALGEEIIQSVFTRLTDTEMIEISRTMGTLGRIPAHTITHISEQFLKEATHTPDLMTNAETTRTVLEKTLPADKAERLMKKINLPTDDDSVWGKLNQIDTSRLMPILEKESPAVLAIILYHLSDKKAGEILSSLGTIKRSAVIENLTDMGVTDADTLHMIESVLERQIHNLHVTGTTQSGSEKLSGILSLMDKTAEDDFLKSLYTKSPETARTVHDKILTFEQLAGWDDIALKTLLRAARRETVMLALKGASDQIKDAFSRNMAPRIWADLMKETAALGAVRINQIDTAQMELLTLARDLKNTRQIILKD